MAICGLKELKDLDYLYCGEKEFNPKNNDISEHTGIWANYYVQPKEEIIKLYKDLNNLYLQIKSKTDIIFFIFIPL